ncbi:GNAT family N-acetyltransferase [Nocardia sp. SYP-A9097]|uniref:GNAT family N-acetyltransferase n=1 Tax=Nocardia sp. SYP-A9097 TaxID=2663237 RepID=UPI00129B15AC|nr:GNAT family N-acetyltransferase [Nocardia sp. SYP-A9097]MRH92615.1 GNAT family N-acetyltransferase [Nocardia sp. SYP-A9097]
MEIRSGLLADAPAVAALHTESWRTSYAGIMPAEYLDGPLYEERLAIWQFRLTTPTPGAALFTAQEESELLGFVYLTPNPDGRILLDNLHVHPTAKRRGLGTRLLRHAQHWTHTEHPGHTLYLEVLEANTPAVAFYERHGGKRTDSRTAHFDQGFDLIELEYTWPQAPNS